MPVFEITKQATFDAAHHFPNEPEGSIYRRVHGHSFTVEATVRSEVLDVEHGWVADLGALDRALKAAAETLDHGMLNEHAGLELPSLEHLRVPLPIADSLCLLHRARYRKRHWP